MRRIMRLLHVKGIQKKFNLFLVNHIFAGPNPRSFEIKRKLLNSAGFHIGEGTKVVAPFECWGDLFIGKNCWIGKNFQVNGVGSVHIGDNCDIGPEVTFQTGGHEIGPQERRAGNGVICEQTVGKGTWIGGRVTIIGNTRVGDSCVLAGCACVIDNVEDNCLVGGVPARIIRRLSSEAVDIKK